jgi:hypothetical protein
MANAITYKAGDAAAIRARHSDFRLLFDNKINIQSLKKVIKQTIYKSNEKQLANFVRQL